MSKTRESNLVATRLNEGPYTRLKELADTKDMNLYKYLQVVLGAVSRGDVDMVISLMNKRE